MDRMVQAIIILAVVVVVIFGIASLSQPKESEIKIGAILPLTGSISVYGEYAQNGLVLALEDINASGGPELKFVIEDSKGLPSEGVTAFQKLAADEDIVEIVSMISSVSVPLVPLAEENKIPLLSTVVAASNFTRGSEWAFRYFHTADIEGPALARFAVNNLNATEAAVLYVNDEYGTSTYTAFKNECESLGCTVIASEQFLFADADYRTQLLKLSASNPDALLVVGFSQHLPAIYKQAREAGIRIPLLTTSGMSVPAIIEKTGAAADGSYLTISYYTTYPDEPKIKDFNDRYRKRFGKEPSYYAAYVYDIVMITAESVETGGATREGIRNGLEKISYSGLMGSMAFPDSGDASLPVFYVTITNGTLVPIK